MRNDKWKVEAMNYIANIALSFITAVITVMACYKLFR